MSLVQADARVCTTRATDDGAYWWASVIANGRWAEAHGYVHLVYCFVRGCSHPGLREQRHVAFCKILAILDALRAGHSPLLYLDSDAFVREPGLRLNELTSGLTPAANVRLSTPHGAGHVLFGGNEPYAGRGLWSTRATRTCAPPNTALLVVRNTAEATAALKVWWDTPAGKSAPFLMPSMPRHHTSLTTLGVIFHAGEWAFSHAWEQRQLWELWPKTPVLADAFRVALRNGTCLRTMFFFPAPPSVFSQARPPLHRLVLPPDYSPPLSRTAPILHMDSASVCHTPGASAFKCSRRRRSLIIALAASPFNLSYRPLLIRVDNRRLRRMYHAAVS